MRRRLREVVSGVSPVVMVGLILALVIPILIVTLGRSDSSLRPSVQPSGSAIQHPTTTSSASSTSMADDATAKAAAESVLRLYLSNPSPRTADALLALRPLVSDTLFTEITDEWKGSETRAIPRIEETRSVTVSKLDSGLSMRYDAEVVQVVDFPVGEDQFNTLSVSIRLEQYQGRWIVHELTVL